MDIQQEILTELRGIRGDVTKLTASQAALTERVGNLIDKTDEHIEADDVMHISLEKRMDALETWRNRAAGVLMVVTLIGGALFAMTKDAIAGVISKLFH